MGNERRIAQLRLCLSALIGGGVYPGVVLMTIQLESEISRRPARSLRSVTRSLTQRGTLSLRPHPEQTSPFPPPCAAAPSVLPCEKQPEPLGVPQHEYHPWSSQSRTLDPSPAQKVPRKQPSTGCPRPCRAARATWMLTRRRSRMAGPTTRCTQGPHKIPHHVTPQHPTVSG